MKKVKKIIFLGFRGRLHEFVLNKDEEILKRNPVIELDSKDFISDEFPQVLFDSGPEVDLNELEKIYRNWGKFGADGDIIKVMVVDMNDHNYYYVTFIGNLTSRKGTTAVDVIVACSDSTGRTIFPLIKRKYNPASGLLALVGGKIDVEGCIMESPIDAALRETCEEIGLNINIEEEQPSTDGPIFPRSLDVWAKYRGNVINGKMECIGSMNTSSEEIISTTELKRVYQTTAFLVTFSFRNDIDKSFIAKWFRASDDAKELVLVDEQDIQKGLDFGIKHHEVLFDQALKMLRK